MRRCMFNETVMIKTVKQLKKAKMLYTVVSFLHCYIHWWQKYSFGMSLPVVRLMQFTWNQVLQPSQHIHSKSSSPYISWHSGHCAKLESLPNRELSSFFNNISLFLDYFLPDSLPVAFFLMPLTTADFLTIVFSSYIVRYLCCFLLLSSFSAVFLLFSAPFPSSAVPFLSFFIPFPISLHF